MARRPRNVKCQELTPKRPPKRHRIEDLVGEASQVIPKRSIASAVNLLVFIERTNAQPGRTVRSIVEVEGFDSGDYRLHEMKRDH